MKKIILLLAVLFCQSIVTDLWGMMVATKKIPKLKTYHAKRDFAKTPEPSGSRHSIGTSEGIFVVQKHASRRLHYDFRLEIEGVLVSWAVPKGLPKRAGIRRLAVQTEDHPLEYARFAGTIPPGEYGAGTVEIFDHGTYENIRYHRGKIVPMQRAVQQGIVEVCLHGKEYTGCYVVVRADFERSKRDWLLMKKKSVRSKKVAA